MNVSCREITRLINEWEHKGTCSKKEYRLIKEHLTTCSQCSRQYRWVIPFLEREVDGKSILFSNTVNPGQRTTEEFTEKVMSQIPQGVPHTQHPRIQKIVPLAAAAVLVIALSGIFFRFAFSSSSPEDERVHRNGNYIEISFTLTAPEAESVQLVGDFTEWGASKIHLTDDDKDGVWEAQVNLKKGNVYSYNFIIDGEKWIADPNSLLQIEDGFGGESSLISL